MINRKSLITNQVTANPAEPPQPLNPNINISMSSRLPFRLGLILSLCCAASVADARTWVVANGSNSARDTNPGTAVQPLLTINAAAQRAQPGDTVLVHSGTYRERVIPLAGGKKEQPITYQAAPGESVSVKGSDIWTHWQPVAGTPGVFTADIEGHIPTGNPNPFVIGISIHPKDENIVARPSTAIDNLPKTLGQVFFDGRPMVETNSGKAVEAQENAWVVSPDGRQIIAHFPGNPSSLASHLIEVSVRNRIFAPHRRGLSFIHVKGFIFEHCANQGPFPQGGAVSPRSGSCWLFEGNTFRFAKTTALDVGNETWDVQGLKDTDDDQKVRTSGGWHVVEGNTFSDNGLCGIEGWYHNGVIIRNNIVERNNALGFCNHDGFWEEWAGIKLHRGPAVIEGNLIRDNDCYGIWLDNDYTGSHISRNVVLNNRAAGIFLELGEGHALIDNNIVAFTRPRDDFYAGCGIYTHDSSGVVIAHNLIYGNADCGVLMRTISDRVFNGKPVHTSDCKVLNNIILNNSRPAICLPYPSDRASNNVSDYNIVFGRRDVWMGFDFDPGLFGVNLYKSSVTVDQLCDALKDSLKKGNVPGEEWPVFKTWRRYPTLPILQWRLFMGQDLHSKETPKLMTLFLRPELPMISYKAEEPLLQMQCPAVDGVDRDFFGNKLQAPNIHPGPFQNISQSETEQVLFPVRRLPD